MTQVDVAGLRAIIDEAITKWAAGTAADSPVASPANEITEVVDQLPKKEGQRVVRTKTSGDRVYLLDDNKNTRQWVTNPEVLAKLGFSVSDVIDIEDAEMLKYNMGPAIYKVND